VIVRYETSLIPT